jgi:hypothetical protein
MERLQPSHSVYFLDGSGRLIGERRVAHNQPALPPDYQPPAGQVFLYWSRSTARVTEDTYCVALTKEEAPLEFCCVTYCDAAGGILDLRIVPRGGETLPPEYPQPEGIRLAGWNILFDDGERDYLPAGTPMRYVDRDCRLFAQCEAQSCWLYVLDFRETSRPALLPLGRLGYGAQISQEILFCLHLRSRDFLQPFRFCLRCDAILALTCQGVVALDFAMRPLELRVWDMPQTNPQPPPFSMHDSRGLQQIGA